jgi:hypothetical protein
VASRKRYLIVTCFGVVLLHYGIVRVYLSHQLNHELIIERVRNEEDT